jgi:hypothetical protein
MSLDVYLLGKKIEKYCSCSNCGNAHTFEDQEYLFEANITHNLNKMASHAGVYQALWRPEEIGASKAENIIEILEHGYMNLLADPEKYKKFNPENGWGNYDILLRFVEKYIQACREYPKSLISVSR